MSGYDVFSKETDLHVGVLVVVNQKAFEEWEKNNPELRAEPCGVDNLKYMFVPDPIR